MVVWCASLHCCNASPAQLMFYTAAMPSHPQLTLARLSHSQLAQHTATQEREQRVVVDAASRELAVHGGSGDVAGAPSEVQKPGAAAARAVADHQALVTALLQSDHPEALARELLSTEGAVSDSRARREEASAGSSASDAAQATATAREGREGAPPDPDVEAACELSWRLCEAHRALASLRARCSARGGHDAGEPRCRLQFVLVDGTKVVETLPASASLAAVAALACVLLAESRGLVWLSGRLAHAGGRTPTAAAASPATHAMVCTMPRLRLLLHVAKGLVPKADGSGSRDGRGDDDTFALRDLQAAGLTPSATLRLQEL